MFFRGFSIQTTSTPPLIRRIFETSEVTIHHHSHHPCARNYLLTFDFTYGRTQLVTLATGLSRNGAGFAPLSRRLIPITSYLLSVTSRRSHKLSSLLDFSTLCNIYVMTLHIHQCPVTLSISRTPKVLFITCMFTTA